ncbi:MAG: DNA-directed RNA polymerase subunit A'/A'', partial [Candidatus Bathyarchaeia archaeon]
MPNPIKAIKFGLLSPDEIRKLSEVEIQTSDTYDEDGAPIPLGLMDGRLGTLEPRQRCTTCGNLSVDCPGHFGHIELAMPVIHVEFAKIIYKLLLATCRNCGRLLLTEENLEKFKTKIAEEGELYGKPSNETRDVLFKEARKYKKFKECPHCGTTQLDINFTKPTSFLEIEKVVAEKEGEEAAEDVPRKLTPSMIRDRFERISDDDLRLFGFDPDVARPEWMILQVLPVPPVDVRPSIILESGIRAEDDLTHKLVDI